MVIDPQDLKPQDIHKLLVGSVVPRPIAWVSSLDEAGVRNLAPFSFFTVASSDPPIILFQNSNRGGKSKDTLANVEATGEFVVNIVSEHLAGAMNQSSADYAPDVDEFAMAGLTPVASIVVRPPRVAESLVQFECRLVRTIPVSTTASGGTLVLGEVVRFHVTDEIVDNFKIDPAKLRAVGRMGGAAYCRTTDRFDLERPLIG